MADTTGIRTFRDAADYRKNFIIRGEIDKYLPGGRHFTILAIYTVNKHTVRFIDHDGNVLSENIYDYNTIIEEREEPTHEGYTFHFWASAVNRDQKVVFPFNLKDNDTTLMAICTINQYI